MKIITYTMTPNYRADEVPQEMRAAAATVPTGPGTHWMATGPTPEAAEAKLRAFYDGQAVKYGGRGQKARKTAPTTVPDAPALYDGGEVI